MENKSNISVTPDTRAILRDVDPYFGTDAPYLLDLVRLDPPGQGEVVLRLIGSAHSADPESEEAKQLNETYRDFLETCAGHSRITVLYEGVKRKTDPNGAWEDARQQDFDVGHLLWLAQQGTPSSGGPEILGSEPPLSDRLRALIDREGGGHDPAQAALYFLGAIEIRGFLARRSQGTLPDSVVTFEDYFNRRLEGGIYHKTYPELMNANGPFASYTSYEALKEVWNQTFPGIELDPLSPWPKGDGPLHLGRDRTYEDYRLLLHGIKTGDPTTDAKIPDNVLRRISNDDILTRDEYKFRLIVGLLQEGSKIFTVQGSRHFRSLFRAILDHTSNNPELSLHWVRRIGGQALSAVTTHANGDEKIGRDPLIIQ